MHNGEWVDIADKISTVTETPTLDGQSDKLPSFWEVFKPQSITVTLKTPKTRKRFIKFLMANKISRNDAVKIADNYRAKGVPYSRAFIHYVFILA